MQESVKLLKVGYWAPCVDENHMSYPPVTHFVLEGWFNKHPTELRALRWFLSQGRIVAAMGQPDKCLLCGGFLSQGEYTDGLWSWPSSLLHYVEKHSVRPDRRFMEYVMKQYAISNDQQIFTHILNAKHNTPEGVAHTASILIDSLLHDPNAKQYGAFQEALSSIRRLNRAYIDKSLKESVENEQKSKREPYVHDRGSSSDAGGARSHG